MAAACLKFSIFNYEKMWENGIIKKSRSKRSAPKVCQSWQAIEQANINYFIESKIYKTF
jgi:hypothetical protein